MSHDGPIAESTGALAAGTLSPPNTSVARRATSVVLTVTLSGAGAVAGAVTLGVGAATGVAC